MTQSQVQNSVIVFLSACLVAILLAFYGSRPVSHTLYQSVTHKEYQTFKAENGNVPFAGWTWVYSDTVKCDIYQVKTRWFGSYFTIESPN